MPDVSGVIAAAKDLKDDPLAVVRAQYILNDEKLDAVDKEITAATERRRYLLEQRKILEKQLVEEA